MSLLRGYALLARGTARRLVAIAIPSQMRASTEDCVRGLEELLSSDAVTRSMSAAEVELRRAELARVRKALGERGCA